MTRKQVETKLKENNLKWSVFSKWMTGQTVGLTKDGAIDYYEYDVERFIRNHAS